MTKSLFYSIIFHAMMIVLTALSLPFMTREPISLPPIVSVELIQITDKTNIPFAPKARKILDKVNLEQADMWTRHIYRMEQAKKEEFHNE